MRGLVDVYGFETKMVVVEKKIYKMGSHLSITGLLSLGL